MPLVTWYGTRAANAASDSQIGSSGVGGKCNLELLPAPAWTVIAAPRYDQTVFVAICRQVVVEGSKRDYKLLIGNGFLIRFHNERNARTVLRAARSPVDWNHARLGRGLHALWQQA